jgi:hypothetical protein
MRFSSYLPLVVISLLVPAPVFSQEVQPASALATLNVSAVRSPRLITDPLQVRIEIISVAPKVFVKTLRWELREEVLGTRSAGSVCGVEQDIEAGRDASLGSGSSYFHTYVLPSQSIFPCNWQRGRNLLFFNGGKYPVTVIAYVNEDSGKPPRRLEKIIDVEFLPHPLSLILGGLVGSLLLATFERLVSLSLRLAENRWPRNPDGGLNWRVLVRSGSFWFVTQGISGSVQFLLGGCAVLMFLILVGVSQDKDLPINFKVNGFLSAVAVGFFTHLLVAKLYEKFVPKGDDQRPEANTHTQDADEKIANSEGNIGRQPGDA